MNRCIISAQPDETTCGPTCLHAVYNYFNDRVGLGQVVEEVHSFEKGGTLGVWLGCHALERGYKAEIFTYNLHLFDPSWFTDKVDLREKLCRQAACKNDHRLIESTPAYIDFLEKGGRVHYRDLSAVLIRNFLRRKQPLLTGLSAT